MFSQWLIDVRRGSVPLKMLLIALFPFYPIYRLHRIRRTQRKAEAYGNRSFAAARGRLGDISGKCSGAKPEPVDVAEEAEMAQRADTFALCRTIGNDLEPRHQAGQSLANVRFILDHEEEFEGVKKLWLLNRISNPEAEAQIIELLEDGGHLYRRVPFSSEDYRSIGYNFDTFDDSAVFFDGRLDPRTDDPLEFQAIVQAYRLRNNYVMNNNGSRNAAIAFCLEHAKWALPFDGNCFLTPSGWEALRSDIFKARDKRYFVVPMARIRDNAELLDPDKSFDAVEEPQIVFREDAPLRFDEAHPYGRRPKVEMLLHLGVDGPWQRWPCYGFDLPPRKVHADCHRVGWAGWVARLSSGKTHLEHANRAALDNRGVARARAIRDHLDMLGSRQIAPALETRQPLIYDSSLLSALSASDVETLDTGAKAALARGPFSVTQKPKAGPSGDLKDYFHPAPYWWPNPATKDGLPYVRRDGERLPGTQLYDAESDRFDRTRLQRLFDDTTVLTLSSLLPDANPACRERAQENLRIWFLDPEKGMSPHLNFAQVRLGLDNNQGAAHGVIETKDLYFLLDAVRMLGNYELVKELSVWIDDFLAWLLESDQGRQEQKARNNHGTCYDLQTAALAAFLERTETLQRINLRAQARALNTITPDGEQPHELNRTLTQHYCAFNLQSWINLFDLLTGAGMRPWESEAGERIRTALRRMLHMSLEEWSHPQIKPFDRNRLLPLNEVLRHQTGEDILGLPASTGPAVFDPHDGIAPFWRLTRLGRHV